MAGPLFQIRFTPLGAEKPSRQKGPCRLATIQTRRLNTAQIALSRENNRTCPLARNSLRTCHSSAATPAPLPAVRRMATHSSAQRSKRSEEHTSELQSQFHLVCRLLLEKKKKNIKYLTHAIMITHEICCTLSEIALAI